MLLVEALLALAQNLDNGKVIVEDELLNFIVVKIKTLSHDEIVLLTTNNFSSEWIEESKRLLFDVCHTTLCRTQRLTVQHE